jgi:hypothetical protein
MDEISKAMEISVEELCKRVEELTRLHWFSLDHVYSFVLFFFLVALLHMDESCLVGLEGYPRTNRFL